MRILSLLATLGGVACLLPPPAKNAPDYARDVAPILDAKCVPCHRPGEIGPMDLGRYAKAKTYATMIAQVVESDRMPPWKPVGMKGAFVGERGLSTAERKRFLAWAAAGAPAGDLAARPRPPEAPRSGWRLGPPDLVLRMLDGMTIPAEGDDVYRMFPMGVDLPRDRYVRAIELKPGNRRVVHHAVVALDRSGTARKLDAADPAPGYAAFGGLGFIPAGFLGGYAPGQEPREGDGKVMATLPAGHTDVVVQMHYHPTGKPEIDRSEIGIYLTDRKPAHGPAAVLMGSEAIDIPAGAKAYLVRDEFVLPTAFNATNVFAHAHLVGSRVHAWAEPPDAERIELLRIDEWDFRWQDTYLYAKPIRLPRGTVVRCEWRYDNSASNPRNPNRPPKRIFVGENSTDEMAGLILGGYCDDGWGDAALGLADLGHLWEIGAKGRSTREIADRLRRARANP